MNNYGKDTIWGHPLSRGHFIGFQQIKILQILSLLWHGFEKNWLLKRPIWIFGWVLKTFFRQWHRANVPKRFVCLRLNFVS